MYERSNHLSLNAHTRPDTIKIVIRNILPEKMLNFTDNYLDKQRNRKRSEFLSEEIISLVRSSNTKEERESVTPTIIGQNTDFINLCRGQIIFFGSGNLLKLSESGQYINDSDNWDNGKTYLSTLVTPIRYYNNDERNNIKTDVIGFLCIDCKEEIYEWEKADSFELQILGAFSDILYVYIKEFYSCFEDVGIKME